MIGIKQIIFRLFFLAEIMCFLYVLNSDISSFTGLSVCKQDVLDHDIKQFNEEIRSLEYEISCWKQYTAFFGEKLAREELHMARQDDQVFLIDKNHKY